MADPQPRAASPGGSGSAPARIGAAALLLCTAAIGAAYGVLLAPLAALIAADAPHLLPVVALARGGAAALVVTALSWGAAGTTAAAAVWLAVDGRRGWWAGLAAAALWLPTGCLPLSLLTLAALAAARPDPPPARARPGSPG